MQALRVLLVDTSRATKKLLEEKRLNANSVKLSVRLANTDIKVEEQENLHETVDVILFGEKVPSPAVIQLTRTFRSAGVDVPVFVLTKQSEARLPQKYQKAGVDDILNTAEIQTPIFLWSFQSTMTQVTDRKKAKDFDVIRDRMRQANKSLAFVTHEINNPLSVIRLAIYHLENAKLPKTKKKAFFKLLVENIEKVNLQMKELYTIRRQLNMDLRNGKRRSALI